MLRSCLEIKPILDNNGIWRLPHNSAVYENTPFDRIDMFLIKGALKFLEKSSFLENSLIIDSLNNNSITDINNILETNYHAPKCLLPLDRAGLLSIDNQLLFYHRRYKTFDINNTVYNISQ